MTVHKIPKTKTSHKFPKVKGKKTLKPDFCKGPSPTETLTSGGDGSKENPFVLRRPDIDYGLDVDTIIDFLYGKYSVKDEKSIDDHGRYIDEIGIAYKENEVEKKIILYFELIGGMIIPRKMRKNAGLLLQSRLKESDTEDEKIWKLERKYEPYLAIFRDLFLVLDDSNIDFSQFKKTRKRNTPSKTKIKKEYNIYASSSLYLLKLFIPYRNKLWGQIKPMTALTYQDLIIIRGVTLSYNFFIDESKFQDIRNKHSDISKMPKDFDNIISLKEKGSKGNNFQSYMESIDKKLFLSAIGYLCEKIDAKKLSGYLAEFLYVAIRNLLADLAIRSSDLKGISTGIHIKKFGEQMLLPDSLTDKIFLGSIGQKSLYKTRERFYENFPEQLKEKMTFPK